MPDELCHCGKPLHYTDPKIEYLIRSMVDRLGPEIKVTVEGRTFMVPRHYLALHGLKGADVSTLGFREVTRPRL